jgi:hypothetical protein
VTGAATTPKNKQKSILDQDICVKEPVYFNIWVSTNQIGWTSGPQNAMVSKGLFSDTLI